MRRLIAAWLLLSLPMAQAAELHYSKAEVRKELVALVDTQLAAFRTGDFARAYERAAAPLRAQFTLKEFTVMVEQSYPLIAHNERAEFGLTMDDGENATLTVRVFGAGGQSVDYRYALARESAGWRISGVVPEKSPPPGV